MTAGARLGAVAGSALGCVEIVLALESGAVPRRFMAVVLAFDVAMGMVAGVVLAALLARAEARLPERLARAGARGTLASLLLLWTAAAAATWFLGRPPWETRLRAWTPPARAAAAGPSVLLVTLDTTRRDHVSVYGYGRRTTPGLERLAGRATVFTGAYANSPYTLSSHASLFTGLLPSAHGARPISFRADPASPEAATEAAAIEGVFGPRGEHIPLRADIPTLAERLAARGYTTGGIVANYGYLGTWTGLARGFDYYDGEDKGYAYGYRPLASRALLRVLPSAASALEPDHKPRAETVSDLALAFAARAGRRPFFLFLNYLDPHATCQPPPPFDRAFPARGSAPDFDFQRAQAAIDAGRRTMTAAERDLAVSRYDGEIAYTDTQLARVLDGLEREGLLDGMLVIVTSDHGELLGEHGLIGHNKTLYEEVLAVPLLVKLPGQRARADVAGRVGLEALPALVERVVARAPDPVAPLRRASDKPVLAAEFWNRLEQRVRNPGRFGARALRAVYDGPYKLVQQEGARDELYRLDGDPGEGADLLAAPLPAARERRDAMAAGLPPFVVDVDAGQIAVDAQVTEQLRALGYLH